MDYRWRPDTTVGFALAGGGTGWTLANGLGTGKSDAFQAGVYGTTRAGAAYLSAALAYTAQWDTTDRMSFALDRLTARFDPQSVGGRVEGGYRYALPSFAGTGPLGFSQFGDHALRRACRRRPCTSRPTTKSTSPAAASASTSPRATRATPAAKWARASMT